MGRRWRVFWAAWLLVPSAVFAETEGLYALVSDYFQALHLSQWVSIADVKREQTLMDLILALDEQRQQLNRARGLLSPYAFFPEEEARRAAEGLMNGIELYSLIVDQDIRDVNLMNNRWELLQRIEGRREERDQAIEVMAASLDFLRDAMFYPPDQKAPGKPPPLRRSRLSKEEAGSLGRQLDSLFGEEMEISGTAPSLLLAAVDDARRALRLVAQNPVETAKESP